MTQTASKSLLFIELGSVSLKAGLVLKDERNRIILQDRELEEKKLKNLLGLEVYRQRTLRAEIAARARSWFEDVRSWALSKAVHPADEVLVVATAAFRDMDVFPDLEDAVQTLFGTRIQVLDGFLEAQMLVNSYRRPRDDSRTKMLFDLGGGSLEIVCLGRSFTHFTSLQLGAGRVTAWIMDGFRLREVTEWILEEFRGKCQTLRALSPGMWFGTGGAVRSFSGLQPDPREPIRDFEIASEVRRLSSLLFTADGSLKPEATNDDFRGLVEAAPISLPGHRRRIHFGGMLILDCLCKHFKVNAVRLDDASVRAGALALVELLRTAPLSSRPPAGEPCLPHGDPVRPGPSPRRLDTCLDAPGNGEHDVLQDVLDGVRRVDAGRDRDAKPALVSRERPSASRLPSALPEDGLLALERGSHDLLEPVPRERREPLLHRADGLTEAPHRSLISSQVPAGTSVTKPRQISSVAKRSCL